MQSQKQKTILITCGIKGDTTPLESDFFWEVLEIIPQHFLWQPLDDEEFAICFTSKHAVQLFLKQLKNPQSLRHCAFVGAVGASTAATIRKDFPVGCHKLIKNIVTPTNELGLAALLKRFNQMIKNRTTLYIFTAKNGKTAQIITQNQNILRFIPICVSTYLTKPLETDFAVFKLNAIFSQYSLQEHDFVFQAKSGQVLKTTIEILQSFFKVAEPQNLPSAIKFKPWERSAKNILKELKLIDREIS